MGKFQPSLQRSLCISLATSHLDSVFLCKLLKSWKQYITSTAMATEHRTMCGVFSKTIGWWKTKYRRVIRKCYVVHAWQSCFKNRESRRLCENEKPETIHNTYWILASITLCLLYIKFDYAKLCKCIDLEANLCLGTNMTQKDFWDKICLLLKTSQVISPDLADMGIVPL